MINLVVLFLPVSLCFGMEPASPYHASEVQKISDSLFESTVTTKNGETIYLRMEEVTDENFKHWRQYREESEDYAGTREKFSLYGDPWGEDIKYGLIDCYLANRPKYDATVQKRTGFDEEEYQEFLEKCLNLSASRRKGINLNSIGSHHFLLAYQLKKEGKHFVVYATTNPRFSILNIREREYYDLKDYFDRFKEIILSVGCRLSELEPRVFENRGIFRNPYWIINPGYGNISLVLHAMSAVVARKYFNKDVLRITPIPSMQNIISNGLKEKNGVCYNLEDKHWYDTASFGADYGDFPKSEPNLDFATNFIYAQSLEELYFTGESKEGDPEEIQKLFLWARQQL